MQLGRMDAQHSWVYRFVRCPRGAGGSSLTLRAAGSLAVHVGRLDAPLHTRFTLDRFKIANGYGEWQNLDGERGL